MKRIYITFILFLITTNLYSANYSKNVAIGFTNASINKHSGNGINIGYGFSKTTNNSIYYSILFNYEATKINKHSIYSFSGNFNLGYKLLNNFIPYIIGSALTQDREDKSAYGFGYGLGTKYNIKDSFSLSLNYKVYDLTNNTKDYEYKSTTANLIYQF